MNGNTESLAYREPPRFEIIGGKVVMMTPPVVNHSLVAANIHTLFAVYLRGKTCTPFGDNTALYLQSGEQYQPDMMVVCDKEKIQRKGVYGAPDLVVEVLSPSTARYDRGHKMRAYARSGVREYWLADPAGRTVEQYVLEDGAFQLRDVYAQFSEEDMEDMDEKERADIVKEFHCTLFDDLVISVEDIFYRVEDR